LISTPNRSIMIYNSLIFGGMLADF